MRKKNLLQFVKSEIETSTMHAIRGGGASCRGKCGGSAETAATSALKVLKENSTIKLPTDTISSLPNDSLPNDSIPNDSIPRK